MPYLKNTLQNVECKTYRPCLFAAMPLAPGVPCALARLRYAHCMPMKCPGFGLHMRPCKLPEQGPTGPMCGSCFVSQDALSRIRAGGRRVALVAFGHMHHRLHPRQQARGAREEGAPLRRMVLYDSTTGGTHGSMGTARLPYRCWSSRVCEQRSARVPQGWQSLIGERTHYMRDSGFRPSRMCCCAVVHRYRSGTSVTHCAAA